MKKKNKLFISLIIIFILLIGILLINYINKQTGELKELNYKQITKKIEDKDDFVLVVSRSNCSHCITYKPKVEQIAKDYKITIYYIDYDKEKNYKDFLNEFNLDGSTPITLFIKNGKETSILNRLEGDLDSDKVIERLEKLEFIY